MFPVINTKLYEQLASFYKRKSDPLSISLSLSLCICICVCGGGLKMKKVT